MNKVNKDRSKITRTSGKEVYANVAIPTHGCNNIVKRNTTHLARSKKLPRTIDDGTLAYRDSTIPKYRRSCVPDISVTVIPWHNSNFRKF
jgi:hypothetical protein